MQRVYLDLANCRNKYKIKREGWKEEKRKGIKKGKKKYHE